MQITLDIATPVAEQLRRDPAALARAARMVEAAFAPASPLPAPQVRLTPALSLAPSTHAEAIEARIAAYNLWRKAHPIDGPPLSDYAVSRESIYAEREDAQR